MKKLMTLCLLLCVAASVWALDLPQYIDEKSTQSQDEFLEKFPYKTYLQQISLSEVDELEKQRQQLKAAQRDGDKFLYLLGQEYIATYTKSLASLTDMVHLSQLYVEQAEHSDDGMIYELLANLMLEEVAHQVEVQIETGQLDKHDKAVKNIISVLKTHQFIINIPQSKWEKLQYHITQGNWAYIFNRLQKEAGVLPLILLGGLLFLGVFLSRRVILKHAQSFTKSV